MRHLGCADCGWSRLPQITLDSFQPKAVKTLSSLTAWSNFKGWGLIDFRKNCPSLVLSLNCPWPRLDPTNKLENALSEPARVDLTLLAMEEIPRPIPSLSRLPWLRWQTGEYELFDVMANILVTFLLMNTARLFM
eukprot:2230176-Rhodomonas_salina.3